MGMLREAGRQLAAAGLGGGGGGGGGVYQEASVYCGRLLLAVQIEERMGAKDTPPSLALTDLKPKDCKFFEGVRHKVFFRFQVFFSQGLAVPMVGIDNYFQVELTIGQKSVATNVAAPSATGGHGIVEWYQAVEVEIDFPYDDTLWPWSEDDYEKGKFPSAFLDDGMPAAYVKVYRCSLASSVLGRKLIGFNRCSVRELLSAGTVRPGREFESVNNSGVPGDFDAEDRRNIIFNKKGSSQPCFSLKDADPLPDRFDPRKFSKLSKGEQGRRCGLDDPAWPAPRKGDTRGLPDFDDERMNRNNMDPYIGLKFFDLERDSSCALAETDFPGFIWVSCKAYFPSRKNCESAQKGPPLLSPFSKYNEAPIPKPEQMEGCVQTFALRVHVFQARDLPAATESGVANAYVEVRFMGREDRTHTVWGSNSPTWDKTLWGGKLNHISLSCLGWPGWNITCDDGWEQETYQVAAGPTDTYDHEMWRRNQHMLRFCPRIELRVMEKNTSGGLDSLLGRCFVDPVECLNTERDPEWRELFMGNVERDEGKLLASVQLIHRDDPLLSLIPVEIAPVLTSEDAKEGFPSDRSKVGRTTLAGDKTSATQLVRMRDSRIQVQILGLRDMLEELGLKKPSVAVYVQTTDRWDAEQKHSCLKTQAKESKDEGPGKKNIVSQLGSLIKGIGDVGACNQNFMEQLELLVQLPDEKMYAPALEFVVEGESAPVNQVMHSMVTLGGIAGGAPPRRIVAWGRILLEEFHPQGPDMAEGEATGGDEVDEEDIAAKRKLQEAQRKRDFGAMIQYIQSRQMMPGEQIRALRAAFKDEKRRVPVLEILEMFVTAPSEEEFLKRSEGHLMKGKPLAAPMADRRDDENPSAEGAAGAAGGDDDAAAAGDAATGAASMSKAKSLKESKSKTGTALSNSRSMARRTSLKPLLPPSGGGAGGTSTLSIARLSPTVGVPDPAAAADADSAAEGGGLDAADPGPTSAHVQAGDSPQLPNAGQADGANGLQGGDEGPAGGGGGGEGVVQGEAVMAEDDEEADAQVQIDTPDGKPNQEWLAFRHNKLFQSPLEDSDDWRDRLQQAFDEVHLFRGRVKDYKRREAARVGILKCKIKVFRKEDDDEKGMSKLSEGTKEATFFEVLSRDPDIDKGIKVGRPYRMYNINDLYETTMVEVRLYCLKAVQVTPGGLGRVNAEGSPYWNHYLEARLGAEKQESDVDDRLNPSFFRTFIFRAVPLPGASQLHVGLYDGRITDGKVDEKELVGETTIDLEDRWFCPEWNDLIHKPREVRDLFNERAQPGVSQGKLMLMVDILEEVRAQDQPPMDIGVLGKTMAMEMRLVIWESMDTAAKDGYTSDVYVKAELIGLGEPKLTDVHYQVKKRAPGLFNYRLKWRCKYPSDGIDYLLRLGVWDENALSAHQCIAEGVLPLRPLFQECFEKNQGKTSPDEMEVVPLQACADPDGAGNGGVASDLDNQKYPFRWFTLLHPSMGFNPRSDAQAKLKISIQIQPRARARANPAGSKRNGPAKLPEPDRPPQPANPIFEAEKCKAYIVYSCKECLARCKWPCCCFLCVLIVAAVLAAVVGVKMAVP